METRGQETAGATENSEAYFSRAAINASLDLLRSRKRSRVVAIDDVENEIASEVNQATYMELDRKQARRAERQMKKEKRHQEKRKKQEDQSHDDIDASKKSKKTKKEMEHKTKKKHRRD